MATRDNDIGTSVPNSEEFTRTLGQTVWLMTQSISHKALAIEEIEARVLAPLMFKQVRVYTKGKQPLAAIIWAYVSEEVKANLEAGNYSMKLGDWRSGPNVFVVDCVSPTIDSNVFVEQFMAQVNSVLKNEK